MAATVPIVRELPLAKEAKALLKRSPVLALVHVSTTAVDDVKAAVLRAVASEAGAAVVDRWARLQLVDGGTGVVPLVLAVDPTSGSSFRTASRLNALSASFLCVSEHWLDGRFFTFDIPLPVPGAIDGTVAAVKRFLLDYAAGTVPRTRLSAPRPLGDRRPTTPPPLLEAVDSSFGELVVHSNVDTIVVYSSPSCPCCPFAIAAVATIVQAFDAVARDGLPGLPPAPPGATLRGVLYNVEENDYDVSLIPTVPAFHLYPASASHVGAAVPPRQRADAVIYRPTVAADAPDVEDGSTGRCPLVVIDWLLANGGPRLQAFNTEEGRSRLQLQICGSLKRSRSGDLSCEEFACRNVMNASASGC